MRSGVRFRLVTALVVTSAATLLTSVASAVGGPVLPNPLRGVARVQVAQHARAAARVHADDSGGDTDGDALEAADQAAQYAGERSAPGTSVSAAALLAAERQARRLPLTRATTTELTRQPLDAEPAGYTDPYWSNDGAGFRDVSGRMTALAVDGNVLYAGAADGGVWKSVNAGASWTSIWDGQPSLSIGALLVGPHHSIWVGTGEANTNADSYLGVGVFESTDGGRSFHRVGGSELVNAQVYRLRGDGHGHVYAATSQGLYRHASGTWRGAWTVVLKPDPNPTGSPYDTSIITDVVIRPRTAGQTVLAVLGWRNGSAYNGFYLSTTGGGAGSFTEITPAGDIDATDIGRTTLAYSGDGSRLYALVESPARLLAGDATNLQGVFVSASGDPTGPYTLIADSTKLGASGSALQDLAGYHVGVQSWYNQALAVDPRDPMHLYVSLEEVFQTRDGGTTFTTASPYWNYGLPCGTTCPATTHPDQHALALTASGQVVIANDGGVYRRPMTVTGYGHWVDLSDSLHTLQYYDAAAGRLHGGQAYWGGLQDNGTAALTPGAAKNIEPAGGDGGMVIVDPRNGDRAVGEYTNLALYRTSDGGRTFTTISPECGYYTNTTACDPAARFIAPLAADVHDTDHWVAAGNTVWDTVKGWDTTCATTCDWVPVHSFGLDTAGGYNVGTAVAVSGITTYAAWVSNSGGGNPAPAFASGIDTNYGGTWHRITSPVLPNRYIAGLTVDPADPAHVWAVFNGYSRRWIPGGGLGVVFESTDGGSTWSNLSGNLPDAPGDALTVVGHDLVLGTDIGLFIADRRHPTSWSRLANLPAASVNDVRRIPGTHAVLVATHGRGLWKVTLP